MVRELVQQISCLFMTLATAGKAGVAMSRPNEVPVAEIIGILPNSLAEEVGLEAGDRLLRVNRCQIRDLIDYQYACADEELALEVEKANGEKWLIEIEKDYDEELGVRFASATFDGLKRCRNKCVFCFVDQLPRGCRATLYDKDDDYRLSLLQGNFITLTNMGDKDFRRIIKLKLSPLYISVHTTDPGLRVKMLGNRAAGRIREQLEQLASAGIEMHTQIVLCPGLNDGEHLHQTVRDLAQFWPSVQSVAIVPVGLTQFRTGLYPLRLLRPPEARQLIEVVQTWQTAYRQRFGQAFVYLSDEIYLLAGEDFPPTEEYDDFPQTENGVGLARLFLDGFFALEAGLPRTVQPAKKVTVITGVLGEQVLSRVVSRLRKINGLQVDLRVAENRFFGPSITVTGLLTGGDLITMFEHNPPDPESEVIIPGVMLRQGETVFLDDLTVDDLSDRLGVKIRVAENTAKGLVETVLGPPDPGVGREHQRVRGRKILR